MQAAIAAAAAGPRQEVERILRQRTRATGREIEAALKILDRAGEKGLPVETLVRRIQEGAARKAPPKAILAVLRDRLERMEKVRSLLERGIREGLRPAGREYALQAISDVVDGNLGLEDIESLMPSALKGEASAGDMAKAVQVLAELAAKRVPVELAGEVVAEGMARRLPAKEIRRKAVLLLEADWMRLPLTEARDLIVDGMRRGHSSGRIAQEMKEAALDGPRGARAQRRSGSPREIPEELRERAFGERERRRGR